MRGEPPLWHAFVGIAVIMAFMYWGIAATTFNFRHPKANSTVLLTHFYDVITFNAVKDFQ